MFYISSINSLAVTLKLIHIHTYISIKIQVDIITKQYSGVSTLINSYVQKLYKNRVHNELFHQKATHN